MITAIYQDGQLFPNPNTASTSAIEVHQRADGEFDARDRKGKRLIGPFRSQQTANEAGRMLSAFNQVNEQIDHLKSAVAGGATAFMRCGECGDLVLQDSVGWACQQCMGML